MNTDEREFAIKRVILITGTPGVGKTSVSRLLCSKLGASYIDLDKLVKLEKLISDVDEIRGTLVVDENKILKRVEEIIIMSKEDVIIDGHYAVNVVPTKKIHVTFVLRRDPDELKMLLISRGFEIKKVWENLASEILDVCLIDAINMSSFSQVCEVDVTKKDVDESVKEIIEILDNKRQCKVGVVDWLGKLYREGRLDEYFE